MTDNPHPGSLGSFSKDSRPTYTTQPSYDAAIDATLSLLAQAQPAAGFEQRIQARLAGADPAPARGPGLLHPAFSIHPRLASKNQRLAASLIAATVVIAGVLAYSSSRHGHIIPPIIPRMHAAPHPGGIGTAGAIRTSPQPVRPTLRPHARGNVHSSHARAWIDGRHKPLPAGVAVPKSPHPDASHEDSQPNPQP